MHASQAVDGRPQIESVNKSDRPPQLKAFSTVLHPLIVFLVFASIVPPSSSRPIFQQHFNTSTPTTTLYSTAPSSSIEFANDTISVNTLRMSPEVSTPINDSIYTLKRVLTSLSMSTNPSVSSDSYPRDPTNESNANVKMASPSSIPSPSLRQGSTYSYQVDRENDNNLEQQHRFPISLSKALWKTLSGITTAFSSVFTQTRDSYESSKQGSSILSLYERALSKNLQRSASEQTTDHKSITSEVSPENTFTDRGNILRPQSAKNVEKGSITIKNLRVRPYFSPPPSDHDGRYGTNDMHSRDSDLQLHPNYQDEYQPSSRSDVTSSFLRMARNFVSPSSENRKSLVEELPRGIDYERLDPVDAEAREFSQGTDVQQTNEHQHGNENFQEMGHVARENDYANQNTPNSQNNNMLNRESGLLDGSQTEQGGDSSLNKIQRTDVHASNGIENTIHDPGQNRMTDLEVSNDLSSAAQGSMLVEKKKPDGISETMSHEYQQPPNNEGIVSQSDGERENGSGATSTAKIYTDILPTDWTFRGVSGGMQNGENITQLSLMVYKVVRGEQIASMAAVPCYEVRNWMPSVVQRLEAEVIGFEFHCVDVIDGADNNTHRERLEELKSAFGDISGNFIQVEADAVSLYLPKDLDMVVSWMGLQKWGMRKSWRFVKGLRRCRVKRLLLGNDAVRNNLQEKQGLLNVRKSPMLFNEPRRVINKVAEENSRQLLLYEMDKIRDNF